MPDLPPAHADLRASLRGVRAFLLDADGVIVLRNRLIDGAAEALVALDARGIPYRIVTNYSMLHRDTLAERFSMGGAALASVARTALAASDPAFERASVPGS